MSSAAEIDALLPQTQCGECGYPGCRPYAEALAQGASTIDRCPPGGEATLRALAGLLQQAPEPYLAAVREQQRPPAVAAIRESECIGCTKCIQACPVDAIIGTAKQMHGIIAHECTGCGLCVEPCPVDCIDLHPLAAPVYEPDVARRHYLARQTRLLRERQEQEAHYRQKRLLARQSDDAKADKQAKHAYIMAAMARVRAKKDE
ncbi:MAG: RnfABCDGE type electron transport complex subunit B [Legionellaceae bacterium]|nr:RnfABCDGE type electron transport complex subunit B [Legionellaceae bacterium]